MTFYKDILRSNGSKEWVNGHYVGIRRSGRLMDALETWEGES